MVFDEVQDAAGSKTGAEAAGIGSAEDVDGRRRDCRQGRDRCPDAGWA
jgi:hypothetical protein